MWSHMRLNKAMDLGEGAKTKNGTAQGAFAISAVFTQVSSIVLM